MLFIDIPIKTENRTKPGRYSFFHGLKKVLSIKENEKALKKDLFNEEKYLRSEIGASKYQNLAISTGSLHIT